MQSVPQVAARALLREQNNERRTHADYTDQKKAFIGTARCFWYDLRLPRKSAADIFSY